jgi:hypothetical protein
MACGGVHNIVLAVNDIPLGCLLFKYMSSEFFVDFELLIENSFNKLKCHSVVLISRSDYFYERIIKNGEKHTITLNNVDYLSLKTVIQYLYLDDISFLKEKKSLNQLMDYFKLAR